MACSENARTDPGTMILHLGTKATHEGAFLDPATNVITATADADLGG